MIVRLAKWLYQAVARRTTMKVEDVMTSDVAHCGPGDTLHGVAKIMWDHDCGCVPVVDASGVICGVITDRDICMAAYTQGRPLHEIAVSVAMSKEPQSARPQDSIEHAQELMRRSRVRRIPVVDEGRLAGMLSIGDILRRTSSPHSHKHHGLRPDQVVETLAAISARA
jgi:CBS domain-containing protein